MATADSKSRDVPCTCLYVCIYCKGDDDISGSAASGLRGSGQCEVESVTQMSCDCTPDSQ